MNNIFNNLTNSLSREFKKFELGELVQLSLSKKAGYDLKCRFPVYPEYFDFISKELRDKISAIEDEEGFVKEQYWR